jgi:hypothetical protein
MTSDVTGWRTSSYSGGQGGNCVEVAGFGGMILVRDTKDHGHGPASRFTAAGWRTFVAGVRNGQFEPDDLGRLRRQHGLGTQQSSSSAVSR